MALNSDQPRLDPGDDESLKRAMKAAFDVEAPSADLRTRVAMLVATTVAVPGAPSPARNPFRLKRLLTEPMTPGVAAAAVAAVLTIAVGGWWAFDAIEAYRNQPVPWLRQATAQAMPTGVLQDLAAAHRQAVSGGWVTVEVPGTTTAPSAGSATDFNALCVAIEAKIGRHPWTPNLTAEGWTFVGARIREAEAGGASPTGAAQMLFKRGGEELSVVTMPAPQACTVADMGLYDAQVGTSTVAGFTHQGTLYAMVAQPTSPAGAPVPLGALAALRDATCDQITSRSSCSGR